MSRRRSVVGNDNGLARRQRDITGRTFEQAGNLVASYPRLEELVWAQEEPQNMGAWRAIRHRLEEAKPDGVVLTYVGRPWRASPSEGYPTAHAFEQETQHWKRRPKEALKT